MDFSLPDELTAGADRRGNEYGWRVEAFPLAIAVAPGLGYACYGGQFQFRLADGATCEMYWLQTDWCERGAAESWQDFAQRSCEHTLVQFKQILRTANFTKEARSFRYLEPLLDSGWDPTGDLVFVAYFETEKDWNQFQNEAQSSPRVQA